MGKYGLSKRWNLKFGRHLLVMNVPQRSAILVHSTNNALLELKGCIAPVAVITGEGKELRSRVNAIRRGNPAIHGLAIATQAG